MDELQKIRNELISEIGNFLTPSEIIYSDISDLKKFRYFFYKKKTPKETQECIEKILLKHSACVGKNQAVKDLQRGLNILNKNRRNSPIEEKNILIEDGLYGRKTEATLQNICKNYNAF